MCNDAATIRPLSTHTRSALIVWCCEDACRSSVAVKHAREAELKSRLQSAVNAGEKNKQEAADAAAAAEAYRQNATAIAFGVKSQLDTCKARLESAIADLASAKQKLDDTRALLASTEVDATNSRTALGPVRAVHGMYWVYVVATIPSVRCAVCSVQQFEVVTVSRPNVCEELLCVCVR